MHNFRELKVWQKSIDLAVTIYQLTKKYPADERFNLISQMQSAATSIPTNVAEGAGRNSNPSFKHFLTISLGSAYELETQIVLSNKLGYIYDESGEQLIQELQGIQKMLHALHNSLQ